MERLTGELWKNVANIVYIRRILYYIWVKIQAPVNAVRTDHIERSTNIKNMLTLSFPFQEDDKTQIRKILLEKQGTIVYPTETFYALGCAATDASAVSSIFRLKNRDKAMPLLVLIDSWEMLEAYGKDIDESMRSELDRFWPGPLTAVLKCKDNLPGELNQQGTTLGFRMTSSPVAGEIISTVGVPLVGTSANRSSEAETTSCLKAREIFLDEVDIYVDGGTTPGRLPSTVVDFSGKSPRLIRKGAIDWDEIC